MEVVDLDKEWILEKGDPPSLIIGISKVWLHGVRHADDTGREMVLVTTPVIVLTIVVYKSILTSGTPLRRSGADDQKNTQVQRQEIWIKSASKKPLNDFQFRLLQGTNNSAKAALFKVMQRHFVHNTSETLKQSLKKSPVSMEELQLHMSDILQHTALLDKLCGQLRSLLRGFYRRHSIVSFVCFGSKDYRFNSKSQYINKNRQKRDNSKRYYFESMDKQSSKWKEAVTRDNKNTELLEQESGGLFINVTRPFNESGSSSNTTQNMLDSDYVQHPSQDDHWLETCQTFASCIHPFISYLAGTIMFILVLYLIILFGKCVCDDTY